MATLKKRKEKTITIIKRKKLMEINNGVMDMDVRWIAVVFLSRFKNTH